MGFLAVEPIDLKKSIEEDTFPVDLSCDYPDEQPVPEIDDLDYLDEEALNGDSLLADPYYELV
jgi:hypothetical protein